MDELMKKYGVSVKFMMLIALIDAFTPAQLNDLEYIEQRIIKHLENN